jgi:hypothetical protein
MKLNVIGKRFCTGTTKQGKQFDFGTVYVLEPLQDFKSPNFSTFSSSGFSVSEISCSKDVINQLPADGYPLQVDFILDNELKNGQLVPVIKGVKF